MKYEYWRGLPAIILFSTLFIIAGCYSSEKTGFNDSNRFEIKGHFNTYQLVVFEYDGCEYIALNQGTNIAITHKGNCKYCAERKK